MKVVILAGGLGTRLSEYTHSTPKPMVEIGQHPIVWHIMQRYASAGFNEFILATGYKSKVIKDYFLNLAAYQSDVSLDMSTGSVQLHNNKSPDWKVTIVDTGLNTMTGGRVARLGDHLCGEDFFLTYGDGVADINIDELAKFHCDHGCIGTVTSVRPVARFGELKLKNSKVIEFKEKPQVGEGWINGGFFVFKNEFLSMLGGDSCVLENEPLENLAKLSQLHAFKHHGFWQCMDTKRDKDFLQRLWDENQACWMK